MLADISDEIERLYAQISSLGEASLTATQLYQFSRYQKMQDLIYDACKELGFREIDIVEWTVKTVFETTMGADFAGLSEKRFAFLGKETIDQIVNSDWSGKHYSSRVWSDTAQLATTLKTKISEMLVYGKTPDSIEKEVMRELGVSYRSAERLIRTEASYTFNSATLERYNRMGVTEVELITEPDCCDECAELATKTHPIATAPLIPIHPNCRCCYSPVIDSISSSTGEDED